MRTRLVKFLIVLAALLGACTRSVPSRFPSSSAASTDAAEAPIATVGIALREDPPLPGESTEGWEALEPTTSSEAPAHGGHVHAH